MEPEAHHVHEVRLRRAPEPKGSAGRSTVVAGGLALVVGLAGGFGYSAYKAIPTTSDQEPNLTQFEPVASTSPSAPVTDDLGEEFRDESVAALFQVPAVPVPAAPVPAAPAPVPAAADPAPASPSPAVSPFDTPAPTPAAAPVNAAPVASNPFAAPQSEPAPAADADVPVVAPKASNWATRDRKALAPRGGSTTVVKPAAPQADAAVDPALFVTAPAQPGTTAAAPAGEVAPLLLPAGEPEQQGEPQLSNTPAPFQRPITDGSLRGPVMPVQFESETAPAAPKSFAPAPANDGFGFADEAPAAAGTTIPAAPPAARSTVPSFDLGGSDPAPATTPVAPPSFPSNGFDPARRPAPAAPFTPAQEGDANDFDGRSAPPAATAAPFVPTPAPALTLPPASFTAEPSPQSLPVPAARANFGSVDPTPQQPQNWSNREGAPAADPFRQQPTPVAGNGQYTGEETVHTVESGENYWTISRKHYGMGRYFVALAEFNKSRIPDPKMLKPGMKIVVPTSSVLTEKYAHLISGAAPTKTYAPQTADASGQAAIQQVGFHVDRTGQPLYRVGEGDTLSDIAESCLGRSSRWVQIYGLNRDQLKSPNDLKLGMLLRLPQDASGVQAAPEASAIR